jgi:hypothetical protein
MYFMRARNGLLQIKPSYHRSPKPGLYSPMVRYVLWIWWPKHALAVVFKVLEFPVATPLSYYKKPLLQ